MIFFVTPVLIKSLVSCKSGYWLESSISSDDASEMRVLHGWIISIRLSSKENVSLVLSGRSSPSTVSEASMHLSKIDRFTSSFVVGDFITQLVFFVIINLIHLIIVPLVFIMVILDFHDLRWWLLQVERLIERSINFVFFVFVDCVLVIVIVTFLDVVVFNFIVDISIFFMAVVGLRVLVEQVVVFFVDVMDRHFVKVHLVWLRALTVKIVVFVIRIV